MRNQAAEAAATGILARKRQKPLYVKMRAERENDGHLQETRVKAQIVSLWWSLARSLAHEMSSPSLPPCLPRAFLPNTGAASP